MLKLNISTRTPEHLLRDVELEFSKFYLWILPLLPSPTFSLRSKTLGLSGKCKGERREWDQQIFCSGDPKLGLRRGLLPLGQNLLDLRLYSTTVQSFARSFILQAVCTKKSLICRRDVVFLLEKLFVDARFPPCTLHNEYIT